MIFNVYVYTHSDFCQEDSTLLLATAESDRKQYYRCAGTQCISVVVYDGHYTDFQLHLIIFRCVA